MLGMKPFVRHIKELLEASEPGMVVVQSNGGDGPFACPIGRRCGWSIADAIPMASLVGHSTIEKSQIRNCCLMSSM
jgi:hypothetical protein